MSKKVKTDAGNLEAAADAQNAPADAADDAAVAAATGQAPEAGSSDAPAGDEKPADATDAGEVQGAADAGADAGDAEGAQSNEGKEVTDEENESAPDQSTSASDPVHGSGSDIGGSGGDDGKTDHERSGASGDVASEADTTERRITISLLARSCATQAICYATQEIPDDYLFGAEEAELMADFVLENPDAPLLAMYKHLEIQQRLPATTPNNADIMALSVFRHACLAALEFLRAEQAELAKPVPQSSGWPGERALQVTHSPFEATGFTPSR